MSFSFGPSDTNSWEAPLRDVCLPAPSPGVGHGSAAADAVSHRIAELMDGALSVKLAEAET